MPRRLAIATFLLVGCNAIFGIDELGYVAGGSGGHAAGSTASGVVGGSNGGSMTSGGHGGQGAGGALGGGGGKGGSGGVTSGWVVIETLQVPAQGGPVSSKTVLTKDVGYRLRASGTFVMDDAERMGDAEYWDFDAPKTMVGSIDFGLGINDPDVNGKTPPNWGPYSAAHVYETMWVGEDSTIEAAIDDGKLGNNVGFLTLEILAFL